MSWPGVRMVTVKALPDRRTSSGSSTARESGRALVRPVVVSWRTTRRRVVMATARVSVSGQVSADRESGRDRA